MMTDDKDMLRELLAKNLDASLLREMIGLAAHSERNPARRVQRNGYRDRDWEMRAGA